MALDSRGGDRLLVGPGSEGLPRRPEGPGLGSQSGLDESGGGRLESEGEVVALPRGGREVSWGFLLLVEFRNLVAKEYEYRWTLSVPLFAWISSPLKGRLPLKRTDFEAFEQIHQPWEVAQAPESYVADQ